MKEALVLLENPQLVQLSLLAAGMLGMALTRKQRAAILDRDNHQSQMRHYSEEKGWHTGGYCEDGGVGCTHLEVHHTTPQGVGGEDTPENLITLYKCEHTGVCPDAKIKKGLFKT
jgi:hypothetical protein